MSYKYKCSRVCIIDNLYGLLQYLLLSSDEDIVHTFFYWGEDVGANVQSHFDGVMLKRPKFFPYYLVKKLAVHYLKFLRWPFLKEAEFWGQDNMPFSSSLVGNASITLIDDGVLSYKYIPRKKKFRLLRKIVSGSIESQNSMGYSTNVRKIHLTGIYPIPTALKEKVEITNYTDLWNSSSHNKREFIFRVFNIKKEDIDTLNKYSTILFTQPLSEDKLISEREKIEIYKKIIEETGPLLLKAHPREVTDYKQLFPNCEVLNIPVPFELLSLIGVKFRRVYTVFSTAALTLPYTAEIHFLGTAIHPNLLKKYGDIKYEQPKN